ncbi:MAG: hypothetical protein ACETVX_02220 [bacterium]
MEEVNVVFKKAAKGFFKGILQYAQDSLFQANIIGDSCTAIFYAF